MSATSAAAASAPVSQSAPHTATASSTSSSRSKVRATILVSGGGTNLQAIIDASKHSGYLHDLQIVRVITDREKGKAGLARAEKADIPTAILESKVYKQQDPLTDEEKAALKSGRFDEKWRRKFDDDLQKLVLKDQPELIINAGFMHVYTPSFLSPITAAGVPMINLHPSLPASYPEHIAGAASLTRAYDDFVADKAPFNGKSAKTGMMIHYVIEEVDKGEPIVVVEVPFEEGDRKDKQGFEDRFHRREWEAIVEGTRRVCDVILQQRR